MEKGLVHIYTGEGKGKTTAAVGLAVRAKARGLRVLFAQFMKTTARGELDMLQRLSIKVVRFEEVVSPLFHPEADMDELRRKAMGALRELCAIMPKFDLAVVDEFNHLVTTGLVSEGEALSFINEKPPALELVLTGRGATGALIEAAHYVTDMKAVKHPLGSGVKARPGIEY